MTACKPLLSVIICTFNPRSDLLAHCLRALAVQTLPGNKYELIIVDNNSSPPVNAARATRLAGRDIIVIREPRQGLTFARAGGIARASADLICFIDDDNEIAPDYLEEAVNIAAQEPHIGTYGGVCAGVLETPVSRIKKSLLPYLGVRDQGDQPITGEGAAWGPWEPIGAGLCTRKRVAEAYAAYVNQTESAGGLGRKGGALLSGEDSLISRIAHLLDYQCGYRPKLKLNHHITKGRLKYRYLRRLLEGHGRSYVLLERISGRIVDPVPKDKELRRLLAHLLHRWREKGPITAMAMLPWDQGYAAQSRDESFDKREQLTAGLKTASLTEAAATKLAHSTSPH